MKDTGEVFQVAYKGVVYEIHVRRTNDVPKLNRPKRTPVHNVVPIETGECEFCDSITFNNICMNTHCESNQISKSKSK